MTTASQRRWLSKQEAADYLGISLNSLRRLMEIDPKTGKRALPAYNPVKGRTVLKREDLDAYMETRKADAGVRWPVSARAQG
jgi:excisionase family DNA binding protein